ncbi:hypothetical protein QCB44_08535 [Thiomicrorhabdus sp. zzn3]|uniref:hypothetical protein n=1 Tax=Thiomicrorhabdus sp. zzn3 TaxID=3039775 RepID=UPI0024373489|nr:hypothetical protein [Thiomicrorhabdus sp. zzn3]MDG6778749.1 hypothetical protein [Thiomicrorhabdus sp. zzn3]
MKKIAMTAAIVSSLAMANSAQANSVEGLGVSANYGLFSGPTLELTYPINDVLQVRGALSSGMNLSETTSDTDIDYDVEADGGINRLALDYHPFGGTFFLSAGYAVNNFKLTANGTSATGQTVEIGDTTYDVTGDVALVGKLDWESGATLSMGWGHSPAQGWGAMVEIGAIFTGAPDVNLNGTGTVSDGTTTYDVSSELEEDIKAEEDKIENDVGDYNFLPILQAGVTYRF